jgi:hypothetical protein
MRAAFALSLLHLSVPARAQTVDRPEAPVASPQESHPGLFCAAAALPGAGTVRARAFLDTTTSGGSLIAGYTPFRAFSFFAGARTGAKRVGPEVGAHCSSRAKPIMGSTSSRPGVSTRPA